MKRNERNLAFTPNPNLSVRKQHEQFRDVEKLTQPSRVAKRAAAGLLALTLIGGIPYLIAKDTSDKGVNLPNINTAQGLKAAKQGVKSGQLVEVVALAPYQNDLDLKGTDLLEQPRSFYAIASDSTATQSEDTSDLLDGIVNNETGTEVAQPDVPYFVPKTTRSVELHKLEEKAGIL